MVATVEIFILSWEMLGREGYPRSSLPCNINPHAYALRLLNLLLGMCVCVSVYVVVVVIVNGEHTYG